MDDDELRRRLLAHDYEPPPITDSTRNVLTKKLAELDKKLKQATKVTPRKRGRVGVVARGLDYSSAEEESRASFAGSKNRGVRRSNVANGKVHETTKKSFDTTRGRNGTASKSIPSFRREEAFTSRRVARSNVDFSDEEEIRISSGDTNGAEEEEEESDDDDDDHINRSRDEKEEEELSDDYERARVDFGAQASFADSPLNADGLSYRGSGRTSEFTSSTPLPSPKSTASYLGQQLKRGNGNRSSFFISPQFRKRIEGDSQFGSLGEAISSLSGRSVVTQSSRSTQALRPVQTRERTLFTGRSHWASKLIVGVALLFSLFIGVKYINLKPKVHLGDRLPICGSRTEPSKLDRCFEPLEVEVVEDIFDLLKSLASVKSDEYYCRMKTNIDFEEGKEDNISDCEGTSFDELKTKVHESMLHLRLNEQQLTSLIDRLKLLITDEQDRLGLKLRNDGQVELSSSSFVLSCWIQGLLIALRDWIATIALFAGGTAALCALLFLAKHLYNWKREKSIEEEQEVFELVEKILSLLANQTQRAPTQRQWLAINHVRDQLLSPKDRKKKASIWNRAESYIRSSESRVREDIQRIFGEEHKSWQWIPNMQWNPANHAGPNPYTPPPASTPEAGVTSPFTTTKVDANATPSSLRSSVASPRGSFWQGSALSIREQQSPHQPAGLGEPPTNCIKVRHLFDDSVKLQGDDWASEVRDEVLRRCRNSQIVHIAVDTESHEGCVFIKCLTKTDAGKANQALHGQWYRGNLIKVTFMRETRYHEKFPSALEHTSPMLPRVRLI